LTSTALLVLTNKSTDIFPWAENYNVQGDQIVIFSPLALGIQEIHGYCGLEVLNLMTAGKKAWVHVLSSSI
jgi:hypothetical protein